MSDVKKFVVPWLHEAGYYSIQSVDDVEANPHWARMSINECPLPPSDKIAEAVTAAVKKGNRYPGTPNKLRTKIADMYGLGCDNVWFGNGSSELIEATR
jgi:histidinol-phosphate/aromatic aminotransferase/cobyric acid decarboxylase-like protein